MFPYMRAMAWSKATREQLQGSTLEYFAGTEAPVLAMLVRGSRNELTNISKFPLGVVVNVS